MFFFQSINKTELQVATMLHQKSYQLSKLEKVGKCHAEKIKINFPELSCPHWGTFTLVRSVNE